MNKADLVNWFRILGVRPGMALEVHSSLSSFGYVEGGADTVIEALMESVGTEGAIVMPSFTISTPLELTKEDKRLNIAEKVKILREDDLTADNGMGVIANTFRDRTDTVLGKGQFRVTAWGKDADLHAASGFGRIIENGGYALLIGVDIYRLSSMHYVEDAMPPIIKAKFAPPQEARAKYPENEWMIGGWAPANKPWYKIQDAAYRVGLIKDGVIGSAKCMLFPVKPVVELYRKALSERPLAFYGLHTKLETQRLLLREMTQDDYPALSAILQDEQTMYAYEGAFSDDETQAWLDKNLTRYHEDGIGLWAVVLKESGEMIGQTGLTWQDVSGKHVPEVGYLFNRAFWGKGYAVEAAIACKEYGFSELGFDEIYSTVRDKNIASMNVAIRNGMLIRERYIKHFKGIDMPHYAFSVRRENKF